MDIRKAKNSIVGTAPVVIIKAENIIVKKHATRPIFDGEPSEFVCHFLSFFGSFGSSSVLSNLVANVLICIGLITGGVIKGVATGVIIHGGCKVVTMGAIRLIGAVRITLGNVLISCDENILGFVVICTYYVCHFININQF